MRAAAAVLLALLAFGAGRFTAPGIDVSADTWKPLPAASKWWPECSEEVDWASFDAAVSARESAVLFNACVARREREARRGG